MNVIGYLPDRLLLFKFNLPNRTHPKILRKNSKSTKHLEKNLKKKILSSQKYLEKNLKKNSKSIKNLENFFYKLPILLNLLNMLPIFN
jgi:hypothetical protein